MEEFRDLDNLYEVSSLGNIRSKRTGKILKLSVNTKGRTKITLNYFGTKRTFEVHRLVAKVFIPNPDNLPCINHKDENPLNNRVENLEWCTQSYNLSYGNKRTKENRTKILKNCVNAPKPVLQYTKEGEFIKEYSSIYEASVELGIHPHLISGCCNSKIRHSGKGSWRCRTAGGFIWKFKNTINEGDVGSSGKR